MPKLKEIFRIRPKLSLDAFELFWGARRYISGFNISPVLGWHMPRAFGGGPRSWWYLCLWGGCQRSDIYMGFDFDIGLRVLGLMVGCTLTIEITE